MVTSPHYLLPSWPSSATGASGSVSPQANPFTPGQPAYPVAALGVPSLWLSGKHFLPHPTLHPNIYKPRRPPQPTVSTRRCQPLFPTPLPRRPALAG